MKVVLSSINSKYIHSSLAVWYLYAAAKQAGMGRDVFVSETTINNTTEDIVADIASYSPDVIGFSTYIWNIEQVHKAAYTLKQIFPQVKIFLGGPEAGFDTDRLLEKDYVDFIIKGEGEGPFVRLLKSGFVDTDKKVIQGYCHEYVNPYTPEYLQRLKGRISYLETSRGCPFNCGFCLSGRDENVRFFDMETAKKNILLLASSGSKTIKFVDRTFNCNDKRAREILRFIAREREKGNIPEDVTFHCEVECDLFTKETLDFLKTLPKGMVQFEAGLQSFNIPTLQAVNRRTDMNRLVGNLKEIVSGHNIHLHIDLIAGLPYEDFVCFGQSFDQAYEIGANVIQLGFLKLLKGSTLEAEKEKYGYKYREYAPYQVISCDSISYYDLLELKKCEDAVERLYNSGKFPNTPTFIMKKTGLRPFEFFYSFGKYVFEQGIKSPSLEKYAATLFEFFSYTGKEELRDIMAVDRIITDNTGRLFAFSHIPDDNFKKVSAAIKTEKVKIFENQQKKAAGGKIGFAILYTTNQVVAADYTDLDPVSGIYNHKYIDFAKFLPENDL